MDLCILRHGIAAERGAEYPDDEHRPLTPEGRKKIKRIASALKKWNYEFDLILFSPLVRAKETAEIAAAVLGLKSRLKETGHLAPSGDPRRLVAEINGLRPESVLVVGHQPYLSCLISVLLSGHQGLEINLKKGGFCHLSVGSLSYGACAALQCLLAPKQMIGS